MRRKGTALVVAAALSLVAAACGTTGATNDSDAVVAADEFIGIVHRDIGLDYDPFRTPADAVTLPSLVVSGTVTGLRDGMMIFAPVGEVESVEISKEDLEDLPEIDKPSSEIPATRNLGSYVTVEMTVESVIAGTGTSVGDELLIQLQVAPVTSREELEAVAPRGSAVFMLDDVTNWTPTEDAVFVRPDHLDRQASTFVPYADGVWFTTRDGLGGTYVSKDELPDTFGAPQSVAALVETLTAAAR